MKSDKIFFFIISLFIVLASIVSQAKADRLKDLVSFAGIRSNQLLGYGLVVGLDGTGDSATNVTLQSMASTVSQFGLKVTTSDLTAKNAAAVMITAELKPFTKIGQTINVTVSSMGKAKSLRGGTLLMTPLKGADGQVYAIANGATVEKMVETPFINSSNFVMNLHQGDFTTVNNIVEELNKLFGPNIAKGIDATSISVKAPEDSSQKVSFMSILENVDVKPAAPKARVVVNARTGTVVIGGDVRVTPAAVSHGSLTVKVQESSTTTPGATTTTQNANTTVTNQTEAATNEDSELSAGAENVSAFVFNAGTTLSDIVDAINAIGTNSADLVAILEALREAGALRAQMIII